MGGFVGSVYDKANAVSRLSTEIFTEMNQVITHRGRNDAEYYSDEFVQFGLMPLKSEQLLTYYDGRYSILLNGSIYNEEKLRDELMEVGYTFTTNSTAEVIVAMYNRKGKEVVNQLRGAFAFIIWDKEKQQVFGARDHFGMKPFFYHEDEEAERIIFASEKKSILVAMEDPQLNVDALQQYMTYQFVPEPDSLTNGIKKLEPGYYFTKKIGEKMEIHRYWRANFQPIQKSEDQFKKEIQDALLESVDLHMRSDVPVGSFLSGGIDSSLIASIAKQIKPDIQTFSVGFERNGFSEIDVAKETADKLGLENISYVITPEEYMNELPKIIWYLGDPLADPACVPLYFVSREARKHVSVALSGEGADELFGGYNIYREPIDLDVFNKIPGVGKSLLKSLAKILPEGVKGKSFIERGVTPMEERYIGNAKMFDEDEKKRLLVHYNNTIDYRDITKPLYAETMNYAPVERMQYIDIHTWMRGDILLKADRMTMAHSLEVRSPFLDKEVFKIASQVPTNLKTADGTTKYILRKAAEGIVPDHVLNRKKLGFPVPIRHWLKDEMNEWVKEIIRTSATDHILNKRAIIQLLEEHCQGKFDHSRKIWTAVIFMVWHAVFVENKYDFKNEIKKADAKA